MKTGSVQAGPVKLKYVQDSSGRFWFVVRDFYRLLQKHLRKSEYELCLKKVETKNFIDPEFGYKPRHLSMDGINEILYHPDLFLPRSLQKWFWNSLLPAMSGRTYEVV